MQNTAAATTKARRLGRSAARKARVALGHSSIAMTLDRYSHWIPSMGEQTAAAMEAALTHP